jgi:hypothetical protein
MLRRQKDEVLDLPPKVRTWPAVKVESEAAAAASADFVSWFAGTDPSRPNDKEFLGRLQKLRVTLHKAKHKAVADRTTMAPT